MFYPNYITQEEYDRIVNDDMLGGVGSYPHCNQNTWHAPGVCCFCDNHYRRFGTRPGPYTPPEANGWGGNMAPTVDDDKAAEQHEIIKTIWGRIALKMHLPRNWRSD